MTDHEFKVEDDDAIDGVYLSIEGRAVRVAVCCGPTCESYHLSPRDALRMAVWMAWQAVRLMLRSRND